VKHRLEETSWRKKMSFQLVAKGRDRRRFTNGKRKGIPY